MVREGDSAFAWRVKNDKLQKVALTLGARDARTGAFAVSRWTRRRRHGAALPGLDVEGRPVREDLQSTVNAARVVAEK